MAGKDYYKILGVPRSAGKDDIRKAYRKLAMKYHPDRNKGNKQAEEKFKDINEAYAVLHDDEKRKQYDNFGAEGFSNKYSREDIFRNADLGSIFEEMGLGGDIFESLFGSFGKRSRPGGKSSYRRRTTRPGPDFSGFGGFEGFPGAQTAQPMKGQDLTSEVKIPFREAALGGKRTFRFAVNGGQKQISVTIPPGIETGQKLRIAGKGMPAPQGGQPGDLYLQIQVMPDPVFKKENDNIIVQAHVKPSQAVLGGCVDITTLEGDKKKVKIPTGTQNDTKLRLRGLGIRKKNGERGDLMVNVHVDLPKKPTPEVKKIFQQLENLGW